MAVEHPLQGATDPRRSDPLAESERHVAELTAALSSRDAFIAVAAHELRNPMTPMMGQLDLLISGVKAGRYTPSQTVHRLERMQQSVRRFWKRASVLLDVARLNSGTHVLEPEPGDLADLVRAVAADYGEAAQRANIQLTVAAPERLPGTWDLLAVEQIIDNLLSNALKYGDRRPVELSAELVGCEVRLSVRDHGAGIPPQERERIFGQFERAVAQGKRGSGFGIGLWLVRQLAVALSGEVTVENHPSGGALFTVTLPQHAKGADT